MARFGVTPRRRFGQHFVADPNTVRRIAALSAAGPGDRVLEIGAGLGSLTLALAETGAAVTAVEVDEGLAAALGHVTAGLAGVEVIIGDARTLDLPAILSAADRWTLAANLPYNIATPLVLDLLRGIPAIETMVVMMQREPAERLAAPPGSKARGIPSVLAERRGVARVAASVPPTVFVPRPRVESSVLRIDRHPHHPHRGDRLPDRIDRHPDRGGPRPAAAARSPAGSGTRGPTSPRGRRQQGREHGGSGDRFELLVRTAFGKRRKMLRRSLVGLVTPDSFAAAGVDPTARPEVLTLRQWLALAAPAPGAAPERNGVPAGG